MSFSVNLLIKIFNDRECHFVDMPTDVKKTLLVYCFAETKNLIRLILGLECIDEHYLTKKEEEYRDIKTYILENYDFIKLFWVKFISEKLPQKSNTFLEMGMGDFKKLFNMIFSLYGCSAEEFISSYEKVNDKYKKKDYTFDRSVIANKDIIDILNNKISGVKAKKFVDLILKNSENLKEINNYITSQFIYKNTDHNVFKSVINMDQPVENFSDYEITKSTVLINAVVSKNIEIIEAIIDNGADINLFTENDLNALILAVKSGQKKVVKCLLKKGANPNLKNKYGQTALFKCNDCEILQLLIKYGADVNAQSHGGYTALHMAVGGRRDIVNSHDYHEKILLNTQIIQLLVDNSANVRLKNEDGISPLALSKSHEHDDITKILSKNKSPIKKNVNNESLKNKCCQAITLTGNQCKNKVIDTYCNKHQK